MFSITKTADIKIASVCGQVQKNYKVKLQLEKSCKKQLYEKAARKMMVQLVLG
jgi:hypothetical protein